MSKPTIHLLKLQNVPIFKQLQLEEALLRSDERNFCIINSGSPPAIVLGISGNIDKLVCKKTLESNPAPLIRRFSGGGTVFINEETLFTTFICNSEELNILSYPQNIFKWSETIYNSVFMPHDFKLQENDYCIGAKKFGGNAQYLRKNRWLHHTSFLFDYDKDQMNTLKFPEKVPTYREKRDHDDFLCTLNNYFPTMDAIKEKIELSILTHFHIQEINLSDIEHKLDLPHRKSTEVLL